MNNVRRQAADGCGGEDSGKCDYGHRRLKPEWYQYIRLNQDSEQHGDYGGNYDTYVTPFAADFDKYTASGNEKADNGSNKGQNQQQETQRRIRFAVVHRSKNVRYGGQAAKHSPIHAPCYP